MAEQHQIDRVWDVIEQVGVCMLTTRSPAGLRARPVEARVDRQAGLIRFVTDLRSGKEHEIEVEPDVGLVFIDPDAKAYLSITHTPKSFAITNRPRRSGNRPITCGGAAPTIRTSAFSKSRR